MAVPTAPILEEKFAGAVQAPFLRASCSVEILRRGMQRLIRISGLYFWGEP